MFEAVSTLSRFPEKGRVVPEVGRPEIREVIYRGHRVIYRVGPRSIWVLTVRHGRRLFDLGEIPPD
ncbi:MAG: type II toxin-antitoxin system RelE/ParE family toxin [Armatimonadota bacterium]